MSKIIYSVLFVSLFSVSGSAFAASVCAEHNSMVKALDEKYRETLSQYGLAGKTNLVEIFISKAGTFTILATRPDGLSCVVATGDNWERQLKNLTAL